MASDLEQHTSGTTQGGFASVCGTSALNDDDGVTGGKAPGSVVDPRYEFAAPQWFDFTAEREREDEERRGVGPERRSVGDRWFDEDHGRKPALQTPESKALRPKDMIRVVQEIADEEGKLNETREMVPRNAVKERGTNGNGSAPKLGNEETKKDAAGAKGGSSSAENSTATAAVAESEVKRGGSPKLKAGTTRAVVSHLKKIPQGALRVRSTRQVDSATKNDPSIERKAAPTTVVESASTRGKSKQNVTFDVPTTRVLRSHKKDMTLTIPKSPRFSKRSRFARGTLMSTEERELQEVAAARENAAKRRRINSMNAQKISGNTGSSGRMSLASRTSSAQTATKNTYPTRAAVQSNNEVKRSSASKTVSGPVTRSQTRGAPKLATSQRASMYKYTRPKPLSTEEREAMEIATKPKFRARAVSTRVLKSRGDHGVPKIEKRKATEPIEPHFSTDIRLGRKVRRTGDRPDAGSKAAVAVPATRKQALHVQPTLTVPKSPAFMSKYRTRARVRAAAIEHTKSALSRPSASGKAKAIAPASGAVEPFQLRTEARGAVFREQFQRDMERSREKEMEMKNPRAALVPRTNTIGGGVIPPKPPKKASTKPMPFNLESMTLHNNALAQWERDLERQDKEEARLRNFTASENPMFSNQVSHMPSAAKNWQPTRPVEFNFHVDARAPERSKFNSDVQTRLELTRKESEKEQEKQRAAESEEVMRLRKSMVFKARPITVFKPEKNGQSRLRSGAVRVTKPQSPVFQTRTRSMVRSMR